MSSVVLQNVRVDFPIYGAQRSLRTTIFQRATGGLIHREGKNQERVVVRALNDVSLRLEEGDRLGLIGHNGSGKSTLLKVLAGIYEPVAGKLMVDGRVTPLFDMMPGLDVEDSGYENIFTAGMLLGMSRDQLEQKIPEIEEFCELGEYLSLPVRTYSTGMTMRLGFAIITALDPGILLMDEGFGTGDLRFTERAAERVDNFIGRSRIIVLASHSDSMIQSMCNKAAIMQEGRIISIGPVDELLEEYHALVHKAKPLAGTAPVAQVDVPEPAPEPGAPVYSDESIERVGMDDRLSRSNGAVWFTRAVALRDDAKVDWNYFQDETVTLRFEYKIQRPVRDLAFLLRLNLAADPVSGRSETIVTEIFEVLSSVQVSPRTSVIELKLPALKLMPNEYSLYVWIGRRDQSAAYDTLDANVALPKLVIKPKNKISGRPLRGLVPLSYEFKDLTLESEASPPRLVQKN
jgi:ABC-type polysaccharide/polyol phosphate transport system ATPase subunit